MHYIIVVDDLGEGGAERAAHNLSNYLIAEKNQVTFIFLKNYVIYPIHKDINVISLLPDFTKIDRRLVTPFFYFPLKKILMQYDKNSTCIVSFNNVSIFLVGLFKKFHPQYICFASIQVSFKHFSASWSKQRVIQPIMIRCYNYYDHILVVSDLIKKETIKFKFKTKVDIIVNPVDVKMVQEKSLEAIDIKDTSTFRFINVGRFHPQKNHAVLVEAFASLKREDVSLYLVGQGQLETDLKNLCKERGIEKQVYFVGLQINPFQFLKHADCFVLSSDFEGFPNVLIEAMACALPIISTDCPSGPREILAPKTLTNNTDSVKKEDIELAEYGILVPTQNPQALAKAMNLILEQKDIKAKYAQLSHKRVQDFDVKVVFKNFEKLVEETRNAKQA